jgi:DNA-binding transcriptional MerR regulator
MRIGELASRAGVNVQSIRFYEREKLLKAPVRMASGYRSYTEGDLEQVVFIKKCQHLGFTLKEIKELADLHTSVMSIGDGPVPASMERIMAIAQERLRTIDEKICALREMRERLLDGTRALTRGRCPGSQVSKA